MKKRSVVISFIFLISILTLIVSENISGEVVFEYAAELLPMANESVVINDEVICDYDESEKSLSCYVENLTDCLFCSSSEVYTLDDFGFTDAEILKFDSIDFEIFDTAEYQNVREISITYSDISGVIDVSSAKYLENLTINFVDFESIDLSNNYNLTNLNIYWSEFFLTELDLTNNVLLKSLNFNNNYTVEKINISQNIYLEDLSLSYLNVENIDISSNINLKYLYLNEVDVLDWVLTNNILLSSLEIYSSSFSSIDLTNNTELTKLALGSNELNQVDLSNNTELTYLSLNWNNLTTIDLSNNVNLSYLSLEDNNLTSLDVTYNTLLSDENIFIDGNDIEEITRLEIEEETKVEESSLITNITDNIILILFLIILVLLVIIGVLILKNKKASKSLQ